MFMSAKVFSRAQHVCENQAVLTLTSFGIKTFQSMFILS